MRPQHHSTLLLLCLVRSAAAASRPLPPVDAPLDPPAATLQLNAATGKCKILQFADMHFENGGATVCNSLTPEQLKWPCSDLNTTDFLHRLIALEQPDLVLFTGDNIDGGAQNATEAMDTWGSVLVDFPGLKWAAVEGNHDAQSTLSREDVFKVLSSLPGSISQPGPARLHGYGNYYITIANATGASVSNLFLLDTGANSEYAQISGYDWAWPDQVAWYLHTSKALYAQQGNRTLPSVAFYHICTPEYWDALDAHVPLSGDNWERGGCSASNSGLFTAFLEQGDVKMTNVGHDHVNDYCANWKGIDLCYGGGCGFGKGAYGRTGWARRARVIELGQDATTGQGTIETWKRLDYYLGNLAVIDREQIWPEPPAPVIKNCSACVAQKRVWCYNDNRCFAHGDHNDTKPGTCPGSAHCASNSGCDCTSCDDTKCQPTQDARGHWHSWQQRRTNYVVSTWRPPHHDHDHDHGGEDD